MFKLLIKNTVLILCLMISTSAWALSLQEAKQQGLVGELSNGYIGAVKPNASVANLVKQINAKRKNKYKEIAKRNGTNLNSVETLAGQKALKKTPAGQFINTGSGWKKK